jgi:hypothetical protein
MSPRTDNPMLDNADNVQRIALGAALRVVSQLL